MTSSAPLLLPALPHEHPLNAGRTDRSPLVLAYRGERSAQLPVWFMRQAGRSLPEYRSLRIGTAMLDACLDPALASEITLQPVRRHGVDAAIFFSDIVVPLKLAGVAVEIVPGKGPVFAEPIRTAAQVAALPELAEAELAPIAEAVALTVAELGDTPLIGFAGAPFTLAAYMVEGGPSKDHLAARGLMLADPETWAALMAWCARVSGAFLRAQVLAGASAAQLFDSWAGSLPLAAYRAHVLPASTAALAPAKALGVPTVHFGVGTGEILTAMLEAGSDAMGIDWRIPLDEASRRLGGATPLQGNIDPALLAAPWPILEAHARDIVRRGLAAPAHVVNLGHGVPPEADPEVLTRLVGLIHELGAETQAETATDARPGPSATVAEPGDS